MDSEKLGGTRVPKLPWFLPGVLAPIVSTSLFHNWCTKFSSWYRLLYSITAAALLVLWLTSRMDSKWSQLLWYEQKGLQEQDYITDLFSSIHFKPNSFRPDVCPMYLAEALGSCQSSLTTLQYSLSSLWCLSVNRKTVQDPKFSQH